MEASNAVPNRVRRSSMPVMPRDPDADYDFEPLAYRSLNSEPPQSKTEFPEPTSPVIEPQIMETLQNVSYKLIPPISTPDIEPEPLNFNESSTRASDTSATESMFLKGDRNRRDFSKTTLKALLRLTYATDISMNRVCNINICIDVTSEATIVCADLGAVVPWPDYVVTWRIFGIDFIIENIEIRKRGDLTTKGVDGIFGCEFLRMFSYMTFKTVSKQHVLPSRFSAVNSFLPPQNYHRTLRVYTEIMASSLNLLVESEARRSRPFAGVGVFLGQKLSLNMWIPYFVDDPAFQSDQGTVYTQYIWELAVFEAFIAVIEAVDGKQNISPFSRVEFYTKRPGLVSWWRSGGQSGGKRGQAGSFCPSPSRYKHFMDLRSKFAIGVNSHEWDCFNILSYTDNDIVKQAQHEFASEQAALLAEVAITASREQAYSQDFYIKFLPKGHALVSKLNMKIALSRIRLAYLKFIEPQYLSSEWVRGEHTENTSLGGSGNKNDEENLRDAKAISSNPDAKTATTTREQEGGRQTMPSLLKSVGTASLNTIPLAKTTKSANPEMDRVGGAPVNLDNEYLEVNKLNGERKDRKNVNRSNTRAPTAYEIGRQFPVPEVATGDKATFHQVEVQRQCANAEAKRIISQARAEAKEILSQARSVWIEGINSQYMASAIANGTRSEAEAEAQKIKLQALDVVHHFDQQRERIFEATSNFNLMVPGPGNTEFVSDSILEKVRNKDLEAQTEEIINYAGEIKINAEVMAAEVAQKAWKDSEMFVEKIRSDAEEIKKEAQKIKKEAESEAWKLRKDAQKTREQVEQTKRKVEAEARKALKEAERIKSQAKKVREEAGVEGENIIKNAERVKAQADKIKWDADTLHMEKITHAEDIRNQAEKIRRSAETEAEKIKIEAATMWEEVMRAKTDKEKREIEELNGVQASREMAERIRVQAEEIKREGVKLAQKSSRVEKKMGEADVMRREAEAMKKEAGAMKRNAEATRKSAEAVKKEVEEMKKEVEEMKRNAEVAKKNAETMKKDASELKRGAEATMEKAKENAACVTAEAQKVKAAAESAKDRVLKISEKIKTEAKSEASKIKAYAQKVMKEAEETKKDAEVKAKKSIQESERIRNDIEGSAALVMETKKLEFLRFQKEENIKNQEAILRVHGDIKKRFEKDLSERVKLETNKTMGAALQLASRKQAEVEAQAIIDKANEEAARIINDALQVADDHPVQGDVLGSALPLTPESFYKIFLEQPNGIEGNRPLSSLEFISILENSKKEITLGQIVDYCPEATKRFLEEYEKEGRLVHKIELFTSKLDGRLKFKKGERIDPYKSVKEG